LRETREGVKGVGGTTLSGLLRERNGSVKTP
jgi:hypothetical protein